MTRIAITGHRGFIGSRLKKELEDRAYKVFGYDVLDGDDIRDRYRFYKFLITNKCDTVYHLAARAGVGASLKFPDEYISTNIIGTQNVIEACKDANVKNLIFFSSSSVLGGNADDDDIGLDELSVYNPLSLYATTKMAGEALVKNSGLRYIIIRPFSVYGEGGREDMVIYKWIKSVKDTSAITVYGTGDSFRGYTHIDDLVLSSADLVKFSKENSIKDFIIHLGGNEKISITDLSSIFQKFCYDNKIELRVEYESLPGWDAKGLFSNSAFAQDKLNFQKGGEFKKNIIAILKKELK